MRTLYVLDGCPYCLRTEIALREKGLDFQRIAIDRANKPPEVLAVSPGGLVPVLYDEGGVRLRESGVICEYLDEQYPEPPLMPRTPAERARFRLVLGEVADLEDAATGLVRLLFRTPAAERDPAAVAEAQAEWDEAASAWDAALADQPWLGGAAFSLVDLLVYPAFVSIARLGGRPLPAGASRLADWLGRMEARPSVRAARGT